jgi:hypothetical protein
VSIRSSPKQESVNAEVSQKGQALKILTTFRLRAKSIIAFPTDSSNRWTTKSFDYSGHWLPQQQVAHVQFFQDWKYIKKIEST